ncbi:type I-E CRISPR-associated protein Cse2/CasB [Prodigiosinella confusarubida]|uniref:Type I-E CRISPR-associated protein Cse2/CasB n=1 Tax=Serratia sp. (strain ATCC 39006) TaxID=104623 RepID=A0A2I5T3U1_SERS3|nr:type I-E CRISPR-associated protein Cse2/CasB [Serratia sp. ATCC 39006]AUG99238.1 type I-E CRISPR-associated protein Cse2/CasB [Serratia sp. ATCC 39006]AUH03554.1 type I-E CRISPR-associated protein Cse2/CasB [Serratia sp. ATCC 39006]
MGNTATLLIVKNLMATRINTWFDNLQNRHNESHNGRAERAELRRTLPPYGALTCAGFRRLANMLPDLLGDSETRLLALAVFTAVAAHAEGNNREKSFAAQLGEKIKGTDRTYLSTLRFERLQRVTSPEEFCRLLIRAVKIRGEKGVNLPSLADGIFLWMAEWQARQHNEAPGIDPFKRNAVRWACEYGQATQTSVIDETTAAISDKE